MIAGGGTGGHLFPALAVAEAFLEKDAQNQILFVGSRRGLEKQVLAKEGYALKTIDVVSWRGKPFLKKMGAIFTALKSLGQSRRLLSSFRPDLVLGMGGYTSGPVVFMAWVMGFKTAIHEQNVFPGLSNRILGKIAKRIFISFSSSALFFPSRKTFLTGNPVRKRFRRSFSIPPGPNSSRFTLFILGGSQGAHSLNKAMIGALPLMADIKSKMHVIHQTGAKDYTLVLRAYEKEGWPAEVYPFLPEIEQAYVRADLILARAGASTLFELMAMGKPAILVPFPFAVNDHQTLNARVMAEAGAALLVADQDLNGAYLSRLVKELIKDRERLKKMGEKAAALAKPEAAHHLVQLCYEMVLNG